MSTIPYTLKFNRMGEWARQQGLFKLRDTYVAYGVRGLKQLLKFTIQLIMLVIRMTILYEWT